MTDRTLTVGVSGHRPNRLAMSVDALRAESARFLSALAAGAGGRPLVALSALAEGSDRAFAAAALDLGWRLHVVLPFARDQYVTTFGDQADTVEFDRLLAAARRVESLPGSLDRANEGYEAVGIETVRQSDVLLAVWDGKPAAGKGGTPHVIEMALVVGKPVIWLDATAKAPLRRLAAASGEAGNRLLDRAAAAATPLDGAAIADIARRLGTR